MPRMSTSKIIWIPLIPSEHLVYAPGYFIEGLLYNVANTSFRSTYNPSIFEILNWLHQADFQKFVCQNEQTMLFGSTPEQWNIEDAAAFLRAMIKLWNDWGN